MQKADWDQFTAEIIMKKYRLTIGELNDLLVRFKCAPLTNKQKEYLFESYKIKKALEDNPDDINDRFIDAKDLVSARILRKTKRIDDLIAI